MSPNNAGKYIFAILAAACAGALAFLIQPMPGAPPWHAIAAGGAALFAVYLAANASGGSMQDRGAIVDAVRRARRGDRVAAPAGAPPDVARVFDELARISDEEERRARDTK